MSERNYLGASQWSHCDRKMWLKFRKVFKDIIPPLLQRTFDIGHALEDVMVHDAEDSGLVVGMREAVVYGKFGQTLGHIDGVVKFKDETLHLLEMKTANDKRFKDMMKSGLPDYYYAQIQLYMHKSDDLMKTVDRLSQCHYMILNKNTSELYEFPVDYNPEYAVEQYDRLHEIIDSERMPPSNDSYKCNFCDYKIFCRDGGMMPELNCGTCANASVDKGKLTCDHGKAYCDKHLIHPDIMGVIGYDVESGDIDRLIIDYGKFVLAPEGVEHETKPTYTSEEFIDIFRVEE